MNDPSIPVMVDDVKRLPGFHFARCSYFTIECDAPSPGWVLGLQGQQIPFFLTGLSGIICQPALEVPTFTSPAEIEDLFDRIEADQRLLVGTADIWLPYAVIERHRRHRNAADIRGMTVRVGLRLFLLAIDFRLDKVDRAVFEDATHELQRSVTYSDEEDKAFTIWRSKQIELSRQQYPKNDNLALAWTDRGMRDEGAFHE